MTAQPTFFLQCDGPLCANQYSNQGYAAPLDEVRFLAAEHGWTFEHGQDLCARCSEQVTPEAPSTETMP